MIMMMVSYTYMCTTVIFAAGTVDTAPLSVYDIIPDEDGGTVIPQSPKRQEGARQPSSTQRPQGKPGSRLLTA